MVAPTPPLTSTGFTVTPAAVAGFAGIMMRSTGGYSADVDQVGSGYVRDWVPRPDSGPFGDVLSSARGQLTALGESLMTQFASIANLIDASGQALSATAQAYESADSGAMLLLDSIYASSMSAPGSTGRAGGPNTPKTVNAELTEPSEEGGIPDLAQSILDAGGFLDLGTMTLQLLKTICDIDVVGWVTQHFGGDTGMVIQAKNALDSIAKFEHDVASGIESAQAVVAEYWSGHAASSCAHYVAALIAGIRAHATAVDTASNSMHLAIISLQQSQANMARVLSAFIGLAEAWGIKAAVAVGTEEIPILDIFTDGYAVYSAYEVIEAWNAGADILDYVMAGTEGFVSEVTALAGQIHAFTMPAEFPTAPLVPGKG